MAPLDGQIEPAVASFTGDGVVGGTPPNHRHLGSVATEPSRRQGIGQAVCDTTREQERSRSNAYLTPRPGHLARPAATKAIAGFDL